MYETHREGKIDISGSSKYVDAKSFRNNFYTTTWTISISYVVVLI